MEERDERIEDLHLASPLDDPGWNENLGLFSRATIFHTSEWARVLHDTYGYKPFYLVSQEAGQHRLLCLSEIDSWLTGRRAVALPFSDECRILGVDQAKDLTSLLNAARRFGAGKKWKLIEIRGLPDDYSGPTSDSFYTHELKLARSAEDLAQGCADSARRAVRKAERAGVTVEFRSDLAALKEYYELHCLTRKKHGVPPQSFKFFSQIHRHIIASGLGFTALARLRGRVLAGAVFLHFNGNAIYKFGASDPGMDSYRPSNSVMWKAVCHLAERGFRTLSFGRTSVGQEGLRRYKLGWGANERLSSYLRLDVNTGYNLPRKTASSRSQILFSRLPVFVLKRIGALAYPHMG